MLGIPASAGEQERLTKYIIARVGDRASGRHAPECLDNYPRDVYFIGNLRSQDPGPQQGQTPPHLPELLNKLAPVAFGAEFLLVPREATTFRVRLHWSCYYRVFPTFEQQVKYQKGTQQALAGARRSLAVAQADAGNDSEEEGDEDDNDPVEEEDKNPVAVEEEDEAGENGHGGALPEGVPLSATTLCG